MIKDDVWELAEQLITEGGMESGPAIELATRILGNLDRKKWHLQKK